MNPWNLAETNYGETKANPFTVAVLPWGACEPHNLHLPYGTDFITATKIGERVCRQAWDQGARVALLPAIPFGVDTNMIRFPMAINMNPSTQLAVLRDIVDSLVQHDVRKLVILNGHGGNDFNAMQRELLRDDFFIALCNWWQVPADHAGEIFEHAGDHANEMETSVGLHLFPELVAPLTQADAGAVRDTRFDAVRQGWVKISRPWHILTTNSGVGDPRQSTAEKGKQYVDIAVERITRFLVELAAAEMDETFPLR